MPTRDGTVRLWIAPSRLIGIIFSMAKYWEIISEKLKSEGWNVRWVEAMNNGEPGWTATATKGTERHSTHANDIMLAFQELEESCKSQ